MYKLSRGATNKDKISTAIKKQLQPQQYGMHKMRKSPADLVHKDTILVDLRWLGWHSKRKSPVRRGHTVTVRVTNQLKMGGCKYVAHNKLLINNARWNRYTKKKRCNADCRSNSTHGRCETHTAEYQHENTDPQQTSIM